jgi:hypothetical protein
MVLRLEVLRREKYAFRPDNGLQLPHKRYS